MKICYIVFFLAFGCFLQPAFADDSVFESNPDSEVSVLKSEYRKCSANEDCAFINGVCGGPYAVNKSSKEKISKILHDSVALEDCEISSDEAEAHCIKGLCEISNFE